MSDAVVVGERVEPRLRLTARRVLAGLGLASLLGFAIVRAAVEDRTPLRSLGVQGCWFEQEPVGRGQTVTRELSWIPERDVYLVGWNPLLLAPSEAGYEAELALVDGTTRIFVMVERRSPPAEAAAWNPSELPAGTGYRVRAGRALTLRLRIANDGPADFWTEAAGAQVRYVPVS